MLSNEEEKKPHDYKVELDEALKKGELSDFVCEEEQILKGGDYSTRAVNYIRSIIDKLPKTNIKTDQINIYISAQSAVNACVIHAATPRIMIVTKGLLELAQSEDELAAVICHELQHIELDEEFPKHENSKAEESMCDLCSIKALDQAGYRSDGIITIFRRFPKNEFTFLSRMFDPHPIMSLRIKNAENVLAEYSRETGTKNIAAKPLPDFIEDYREENPDITLFPSYIEAKLNLKSYHTSNTTKKMQILADIINEEKRDIFLPNNAGYFQGRLSAILAELKELKIDLKNKKQEVVFGNLFDAFLLTIKNGSQSDFYRKGLKQLYKKQRPPYQAYGSVLKFIKLSKQFAIAKTSEEADALAKEINELVKTKNFYRHINADFLDLDIFSIPKLAKHGAMRLFKQADKELPWSQLLDWSKSNIEIRDSLKYLGVLDVVASLYSKEEKEALGYPVHEYYNWYLVPVLDQRNRYDRSHSEMLKGKLVYKKPIEVKHEVKKELEFTAEAETARLKERDERAKALDVNWELFETDYPAFLNLYIEYLVLEETMVDGGFYFASKVMERIEAYDKDENTKAKADELFSQLMQRVGRNHSKSIFLDTLHYQLGVSVKHPIIQYAFKHFDTYRKYIPQRLFTHINRELFYQSPPQRDPKFSYDLGLLGRGMETIYENYQKTKAKVFNALVEPNALLPMEYRWRFYEYEKIFKLDRATLPEYPGGEEKEEKKIEWLQKAYSVANLLKIPYHDPFSGGQPNVWMFEAYLILTQNPYLYLSTDEYVYLSKLVPHIQKTLHKNNEMAQLTEQALNHYDKRHFERALEEKDFNIIVKNYHVFHSLGTIFSNFDNVKRYEALIRDVLSTLKTPAEKKQMLEDLLFKAELSFDGRYFLKPLNSQQRFTDPNFKNWAVAEYAKALTQFLGKDEAAGEATAKLEVDKVIDKVTLNIAIPVLKEVADAILAQKTLSFYMRDKINKASIQKLLKEGVSLGSYGEILITEIPCDDDPSLRTDTIEFLLTKDKAYDLDNYIHKLVSNPESRIKQALAREGMHAFSRKVEVNKHYESNKEYYQQRFLSAKGFFDDLSFEQQILVIDQFLFPAENPITINEGKRYVLNQLFSGSWALPSMLANAILGKAINDPRSEKESRLIVESYLEALEEIAKDPRYAASLLAREKLILSAMLIANAQSRATHDSKKSGRGEALKQVLDAMGPAGRKMAQAIESHSETPLDIQEALKSSKTNAAPPARWEVHEWIESSYPVAESKDQDGLEYLGKILGSGSYGVTVAARKQSGKETAITFLRSNMAAQAEEEFLILDTAAKILIRKNATFKPVDDMQREAAASSIKEVDMDVAFTQQKLAEKLYDGFEITVQGLRFKFGIAQWVGHGKNYKETEIIEGEHFNDLKHSQEFKDIQKQAALAILTSELLLLFKGGEIDNDRHGGQQKLRKSLDGTIFVGNFDFGGLSLVQQSEWQKDLLGNLVGEALWKVAFYKKPFDGKLIAELGDKYAKQYARANFKAYDGKEYLIGNEKASRFVGRVKRCLLALGNYITVLKDDPEQIKTVLGAVLGSGQVDRKIELEIRKQLGVFESKIDDLASESKDIRIALRKK